MEFAALIALTVLIGMLIILVAIAVGKQKGEISDQLEQKEEDSVGKLLLLLVCMSCCYGLLLY